MKRFWRFAAALAVLAISIYLLVWSLWPAARETLIVPIPPGELQLPTPSSLLFYWI
jgi:hypothetical protein